MKIVLKITIINLGIVILYFLLFRMIFSLIPFRGSIDFRMLNVIYPISLQIIVNLGLSIYWFAKKRNELGMGFLLSILVVVLVGQSMCSLRF
jgi:hypothetical protein